MVGKTNRYSYVRNRHDHSLRQNRNQQENLYPKLPECSLEDDLSYSDSSDNVSYESDHAEYDDARKNADNSLILSILERIPNLLWLSVVLIIIVYFILNNLRANSEDGNTLKRYKQQINSILRRNFTVEYEHGTNTKAVLWLIGEKWVNQKPVEPYVVLIAGTKADMLANALGDVFSNVTGKGEIDRIFCNEYKERQLLESEVTNSLSKYIKSVVLYGIDKLRGRAPLYLHSLSDPDHSPFPSALILLTINLFFGSHPTCEDAISSYLLNIWDSDYISEEQIRPILSRISSFLICLED